MNIVYVVSPHNEEIENALDYGRRAAKDSERRDEFPRAPHIYPNALCSENEADLAAYRAEREVAIKRARFCAVYCDHGLTDQMNADLKAVRSYDKPILYRLIGK